VADMKRSRAARKFWRSREGRARARLVSDKRLYPSKCDTCGGFIGYSHQCNKCNG